MLPSQTTNVPPASVKSTEAHTSAEANTVSPVARIPISVTMPPAYETPSEAAGAFSVTLLPARSNDAVHPSGTFMKSAVVTSATRSDSVLRSPKPNTKQLRPSSGCTKPNTAPVFGMTIVCPSVSSKTTSVSPSVTDLKKASPSLPEALTSLPEASSTRTPSTVQYPSASTASSGASPDTGILFPSSSVRKLPLPPRVQ